MRSTYLSRMSHQQLLSDIKKNEKRLYDERLDLEKRLREKIGRFQVETLACFKDICSKIDSFDMRKLYSEYLGVLGDYKEKVEENK
jgi:hypothetical protein